MSGVISAEILTQQPPRWQMVHSSTTEPELPNVMSEVEDTHHPTRLATGALQLASLSPAETGRLVSEPLEPSRDGVWFEAICNLRSLIGIIKLRRLKLEVGRRHHNLRLRPPSDTTPAAPRPRPPAPTRAPWSRPPSSSRYHPKKIPVLVR